MSDFWPHGAVSQAYGVFDAERGSADRAIFLIDKQGTLRWSKRYERGVLPDNGQVLAELAKLK